MLARFARRGNIRAARRVVHERSGLFRTRSEVPDQLVDTAMAAMRIAGDVDAHDAGGSATDPGGAARPDPVAKANEVLATASGPERNVLPNAPTGWARGVG